MNPGHLSGPLYQTDFWGLVFLKCVCLLWTPVSLNKTRGHFWRLATCTHIQMLGTPPSVHRLGIISFPFLAASKENIYHMLRQVSFYSNTFPQGKQNTGCRFYFEELKLQQRKKKVLTLWFVFFSHSLIISHQHVSLIGFLWLSCKDPKEHENHAHVTRKQKLS